MAVVYADVGSTNISDVVLHVLKAVLNDITSSARLSDTEIG